MNRKLCNSLLIIVLFINIIGFYFLDKNNNIFVFDIEDIITIINVITFLILQLFSKGMKYPEKNFNIWVYGLILLIILSSIQSANLFNQSIFDGILAQRKIFSMALLYFPISKMVYNKIIEKEQLEKIFDNLAKLQLVLFIIQYFLSNEFTFLHVHSAVRFGDIRYYFNPILLDYFLIKNLNEFSNKETKNKLNNILYIALILFEVMVVQKYRLTSVGLIIIIVFGIFIKKTKKTTKLGYILLAIIFFIFILNTKLVQDIFSEIEHNNSTISYGIRDVGKKLYLNTIKSHPILGAGYPKNYQSYYAAGYYNKIYLSDNGVVSFLYMYGMIGFIWIISLWIYLVINGYKILNKTNSIVYLLFSLFFVITCINELHWYWQNGLIIFIIFLILFENKLMEVHCMEDKNETKIN